MVVLLLVLQLGRPLGSLGRRSIGYTRVVEHKAGRVESGMAVAGVLGVLLVLVWCTVEGGLALLHVLLLGDFRRRKLKVNRLKQPARRTF